MVIIEVNAVPEHNVVEVFEMLIVGVTFDIPTATAVAVALHPILFVAVTVYVEATV